MHTVHVYVWVCILARVGCTTHIRREYIILQVVYTVSLCIICILRESYAYSTRE